MLTAIYGGVDETRGLREQEVGDPSVKFGPSAHTYDEPFIVLPEGWESMSKSELRAWSVNYLVAEGRVQTPSPRSGQVAVKGDWDGYTASTLPARPWNECELCGSQDMAGVEDGIEDGVLECRECGWDTQDGTEYLSLGKSDDELIDRQPGDGWFLGSRPGGTAMYSTDEFAASRVTYHEGEPVMVEVPVIEWDAYPAGWDVPVTGTVGLAPIDRPVTKRRDMRDMARRFRPTRNWVGDGGTPPSPIDPCTCPHDLGDCLPLIVGYNDADYCSCASCHTMPPVTAAVPAYYCEVMEDPSWRPTFTFGDDPTPFCPICTGIVGLECMGFDII